LSSFIKNNIRTIILLSLFFVILIIFHIGDYISRNKKREVSKVLYFDSLKEKDIVPFHSVINGDFSMYAEVAFDHENYTYFESSDIIKFNHNNVYFCKDNTCLDKEKYDYVDTLYSVGNTTKYSYYVPSYNEVFNKKNTTYTGWELYYLSYSYYVNGFHTHYAGTFYDILLMPTTNKVNSCIKDNTLVYGIDKGYKVISNDNFNKEDNTYTLGRNTDGKLEIEFDAKEGDKILFDLKTTSTTFRIYLNDKDITKKLGISDSYSIYNYYSKYNNKMFYIENDGKYILRFEDNVIKDENHERFNSFVSIKDIVIFSDSSKEESNRFYTYCKSDRIVGSSDNYEKE
jgi:hypothetical protein